MLKIATQSKLNSRGRENDEVGGAKMGRYSSATYWKCTQNTLNGMQCPNSCHAHAVIVYSIISFECPWL
jgi:hypothetical protein